MIKLLKYLAALLNAVVIGFMINGIVVEEDLYRKDGLISVVILVVSSYCLFLTLSQAILEGKNLPSAWINRKKAEQWAQIKKFSGDENIKISAGKFGHFITTLVLLTFVCLSVSFGVEYHSLYTEEIVVGKVERSDDEAKQLYEEAIKKEKKEHEENEAEIYRRYRLSRRLIRPTLDPREFKTKFKSRLTLQDFKYKDIYGERGFQRNDLIRFALFGLYGLITLPILFGSLFGRKEPSLIRLIVEHKRLKEEAKTRDLSV